MNLKKVKWEHLHSLCREFEVLSMGENEGVDEYFVTRTVIANQMTTHGERMKQVLVVEKILGSMITRFNYVVFYIEESNDIITLSIDEIQIKMLVHDQRMNDQRDLIEKHTLKSPMQEERLREEEEYFQLEAMEEVDKIENL
ncbi:uncharacterized protein LOC131650437 [Vicia villosa]|uniref:uncharacterized protein LOC131650437 n=1 Tax=Vicia villosa TaxID=3911 RepID=UPI00273BCB38|nr:uncharacterized protein LOC131650437 [Vicia villosa]